MIERFAISGRGVANLKEVIRKSRRPTPLQQVKRNPRMPTGQGGGDNIYKTYCAEIAPAALTIQCYKDYNATSAAAWVISTYYALGNFCIGSDGNAYRCTADPGHTSTLNDKPITGGTYNQYWTAVEKITVQCRVHGGGYLNTAIPEMIIGSPMEVWDNDGIWRSLEMFNGATGCEIVCEE